MLPIFSKSLVQNPLSLLSTTSVRTYAVAVKGNAKKIAAKKARKFRNQPTIPLNSALGVLRAYSIGKEESTLQVFVKYDRFKYNKDVNGSVMLPKPMSQDSKLLVFAEGKDAELARQAGADIVGGPELIEQIQEGTVEFNKCLSTPAMLPHVTKIARILGPRGLMPTVKKGNVTTDLAPAIKQFKGMFDYQSDKTGMIRVGVAKLNFTDSEIKDNIQAILGSIHEIGSSSVKKGFIQQVCLSANHTPGLLVDDVLASTLTSLKFSAETQ